MLTILFQLKCRDLDESYYKLEQIYIFFSNKDELCVMKGHKKTTNFIWPNISYIAYFFFIYSKNCSRRDCQTIRLDNVFLPFLY